MEKFFNESNLKNRISILRDGKLEDGYGGFLSEGMKELTKVWAEVLPISAIQTNKIGQLQQETTHLVTIRFKEGLIKNSDKISYKGKEFDIVSAINYRNEDKYYEIQCREIGN